MTKEELYKAAEERFNKHCAEDYCYPSRPDSELYKDGYKDGCEYGMKEVCKICEQNMLEEHPNACGCAFRRLGNEYCWEFEK